MWRIRRREIKEHAQFYIDVADLNIFEIENRIKHKITKEKREKEWQKKKIKICG